jgi:hypothetical protein
MNVITKKVTGWAAIIAVPTFITGFRANYRRGVPGKCHSRAVESNLNLRDITIAAAISARNQEN